MKKINIYSAKIEADYNADVNGNAFKLGELNNAEYGEEWDGNVEGYVANIMDGDYELHDGVDCNLDMGTLTDADNIHTMWVDGQPVEIWFAR